MRHEIDAHGRLAPVKLLTTMAFFLWPILALTACEGEDAVADTEISDAAQHEMALDPAVDEDRLQVSTIEGVVTLDGTTDNLLAKERAERIAETVRGVRSVVNLVEVEPMESRPDEVVEEEVMEALLNDPATDSYEVNARVTDGVVTLSGTVESWTERDLCETVAKGVRGIVDLENEIAVEPSLNRYDMEIQREIEEALRWDVLVDHGLIEVTVENGNVTLQGIVGSAAEKREARYDAWVSGVSSVDVSDLNVTRWARDDELRTDKYVDVSDDSIEEAIELALLYDPRVQGTDISVSCADGVVTMDGTVESLRAWRAAVEVAHNTVGVSFVENNLTVEVVDPPTEEEITEDVENALERDPYLDAENVFVTVAGGIVTLSGTVESNFQRAHADEVASRIRGVIEVNNLLNVTESQEPLLFNPFVSRFHPETLPWYEYEPFETDLADEFIENSIEREFFWSPFVDGDDITVVVENGVATLTGTVESLRERQDATENAFEGGAVWVENELIVLPGGSD